ncbi:MAG: DUF362 domain-containing protein [Fidelibacterota bacterium]|nr:MAG: DUF362 domain-containing protein [Candidatus Neomarinimicrobiota bacterium]
MTRRDFLKQTASAAVGSALYLGTTSQLIAAMKQDKIKVVLVRHKAAVDSQGNSGRAVLEQMLDDAVVALSGEAKPELAWKKWIQADDIVGIKTNVWSPLPVPTELEDILRDKVLKSGVDERRIGIRDRGLLGDQIFTSATALINVRPLRTHYWSGVGSLLKNYITFVPRPSAYHDDTCADLASIWKMPLVEGKTRLNILVVLTPLFHGTGPHHFNPQYVWTYQGLLVGTDPVAIDSVGVRLLQAKRREFFGEDRPLNPPPKHVFLADTRHHLGVADPAKIELIKIGWEEEVLL